MCVGKESRDASAAESHLSDDFFSSFLETSVPRRHGEAAIKFARKHAVLLR